MSKKGIIGVIVFWFFLIGYVGLGLYNQNYLKYIALGFAFLIIFLILSWGAYEIGKEFDKN